ncbi:MAG: HD domain-containing protein [Chloroflexi bacterium]|nr:MAG: HD domain-containing protein [Chloroflexota bacterium]MBL1196241.1 HD domain-containing protein [Chloroflexota bacterium]NOH13536.1 HD domain-containing protein [Chloroflexota bacterium]
METEPGRTLTTLDPNTPDQLMIQLETTQRELESLRRAEHQQRMMVETLGRLGRALSASLDLHTLLEMVCKESTSVFNVEAAFLWLVAGDDLFGFAGFGDGRELFIGKRVSMEDPLTVGARIIREKRPYYINDTMNSTEVNQDLIKLFNVQSLMGVPLLRHGKAIGALMIIDKNDAQRFDKQDIEMAEVFGSHAAIALENATLIDEIQQSNLELIHAYGSTLEGWVRALDLRHKETEGHTRRVTEMTVELAKIMECPPDEMEHIRRGALLHDIGKIAIPDEILLKPGRLTDDEWVVMRQHPVYAYQFLSPIPYLQPALHIPHHHHEKWDGSGYPDALQGTDIPLPARIFTVVDVWDALSSDRVYRQAWPQDEVYKYLQNEAGKQFDSTVIKAFLEHVLSQH